MTTFGKRNRIRIGQWNVRTLRETSRLAQLEAQIEKYNVAVLAVSEMRWCGNGEMVSANGNVVLHSGKENRSESGVGFIITKDLRKALYSWSPISDRIITARFYSEVGKYVTIVQCYAPTEDAEDTTKDDFYSQLTATVHKIAKRDILILTGDFNAKIGNNNHGLSEIMGQHGMGTKNNNGERFIEFCQTFQLVIGGSIFPHKNIHKYTWTSANGYTRNQIDHICIRRKWRGSLIDVRTNRGADIDSDHELVVATIRIKLKRMYRRNPHEVPKRYNVRILQNKERNEEVGNALRECVPSTTTTWEETCNSLRNIAENEIGFNQKTQRKVWISDSTWNLIQERNTIKQQLNENPNLRARYSALAKAVKRAARNDKRRHLETMAIEAETAAGANNMKELHQIISRLSNQNMNRSHAVKDENGNLLTNGMEQTRRWRQHFADISNLTNLNDTETHTATGIDVVINNRIQIEHPGIEEIADTIIKLKRNKAPGEDGIPPELLQSNPMVAAEIIYPFIYEAWSTERFPDKWTKGAIIKLHKKNDRTDCNNWRGITLLNAVYKVIAMIINNRLKCVEEALRDEQAGFRPHRNCVDQTNTLRIIIEQSVEWRSPLYLVFVDFKKAFDSIRRSAIWASLRAKGVPPKIINLIQAMYTNTKLHVRHNGMTSDDFETNAGVKQGCPLSPLLFATILDEIMLKLSKKRRGIVWNLHRHLEDLDFADDICLMSHKFTDMQDKLNELVLLASAAGLEINIKKTQAMRINNSNDNHIMIQNQRIQYVKSFCYLGCMMSTDGGVEDDVTNRLSKARSAFGRLNKIWRSTQISLRTKTRIFDSCVKSTLLYGSETWQMTNAIAQRLQVFVNKCLRIIRHIFWPNKISNTELWRSTNEEPIIRQITRRKWKWIGHTLRKPHDNITKTALEWNPQGSRRPGRPKNTWRRTVLQELQQQNKTFDDVKTLCNDRIKWNSLVEALCSQVE